MKEDYEDFEGKEIICDDENFSGTYKGLIIGCDPDIGITIVDAKNKEDYVFCLPGPSSPLWGDGCTIELYKAGFAEIISQFKKEKLIYKKILETLKVKRDNVTSANAENCPFGQ